jgi:integrase
MGRHRRTYPEGRLRLKYPKQNYDAQKQYTLYYEYTWLDDAPIRKDTGLRVRVADWNEKGSSGKGELRASYGADYKRQNTLLSDTLSKYNSRLHEYSTKHPNRMTSEIIHSIVYDEPLTRQDEGQDFVEYVTKILKARLTIGRIGKSRYENGVSNMKGFSQFLAAKELGTYKTDAIYLGDISESLVLQYIDYRRDVKKNSDATINHALTPIIIACEKAKDEGFLETKVYSAIKALRIEEKPNLDAEAYDGKSALTKEELGKLVEFYDNDSEQRRKEYIEMFLFAFHAGGLRMVDVMTLTWNCINFETKELRKTLVKTARGRNPRHTVPLNDAALTILNKWKGMGRRDKFVFDLVPDTFDINDEDAIYYARNNCDRKVNQSLAVVAEKIGLKKLGFHMARHTFAILALNDGMSLSVVSRMLGHATTDITETVYAEYLPRTLAQEMQKLNYGFIPNLTSD